MDWDPKKNQAMDIAVKIPRGDAAKFYNLLCDNAAPWNEGIRTALGAFVSPTEAFNAKLEMKGEKAGVKVVEGGKS